MTTPTLASFDSLLRGDDAPRWVRDGISDAWAMGDIAVRLIVLSENVTFRVESAGVPVAVVRVSRPGYVGGLEHIDSELRWIEALRTEIGLRTPSPLPTGDGAFVANLRDPDGAAWTAVAFSFVPGRILEEAEGIARHFPAIGAITARMHAQARTWEPPHGFTRFNWDLPALVGSRARWGDWRAAALSPVEFATLERAEAQAMAMLDGVDGGRVPRDFGLIHGDLRPSNVMVTNDSSALTVIDFDDCGYGYFLYDFAAALTFYEHRDDATAMAAGWWQGYGEQATLTRDDATTAVALSMIRRLTMLGWATTHREDSLPPDLWAENTPGTVEVAARYLADGRWLLRD